MGTTTNYALRYPEPTDVPNVQPDLKNLAQDIDGKVIVIPIGYSLEYDYGAAQIPSWALLQYGQAVSRTTYAALHALASAASYPHGSGDGSTTFNIADKRGRISAGKDDMGGTAANRITSAISGTAGTVLGAAVGNEGVTLAVAQIPSHDHSAVTNTASANHSHSGTTGTVSSNHTHGWSDPTHAHNVRYSRGWLGQACVNPSQTSNPSAAATYGTQGAGTGTSTYGQSADHYHGWNSGGASANHYHGITAQGGGGVHMNTGPTIIVNKIVRAL